MDPSKKNMAIAFSMMLICFTLVGYVYFIDPVLQSDQTILDEVIAFYIDTMTSVESGSVKISTESETIRSIVVVYREKGDDYGYDIERDGWYVVVTRKGGPKEVNSASLIRTYPKAADVGKSFVSPEELCVVKKKDSIYPEVSVC